MLYSATTLLGALIGGVFARKKGGNRYDIAQYAAVCAVIGFVCAVLAYRATSFVKLDVPIFVLVLALLLALLHRLATLLLLFLLLGGRPDLPGELELERR